MKVTARSRLQYRLQHILFSILLFGCIIFIAWLSNEYDTSSDWTAGKRHSLSDDTIQLISLLEHPVNVRSYQPDDALLQQAITEILQRYQSYKDDFSYQIINPDIFIAQLKADNIQHYGQTIIEYDGKLERIDSLSEESISNALLRLQRKNNIALNFLIQHGEHSIKDNSPQGYSQLANQLTNRGFDIVPVSLLKNNLSTENSLLILGSINKPLLAGEVEKIQQYIDAGGNLLWLQDPGIDPSQKFITDALNINFLPGVLVDNNRQVSQMLQLSHPTIIPVLEYKLHPITSKMQYFTLFTTASAVTSRGDSEWISSDLLISSETSWSETTNFTTDIVFSKASDIPGPLVLGLAKQRQIKLADNLSSQRVVIIGDADFLSNNKLGQGANLDFIINTISWLTKNDRLISISPKNAPDLQLNLSTTSAAIIGLLFLVALPLMFFICGAFIWMKRRKQ